uniref:Uncharacterized protein n=1 Tax=Timema cristinae TaxID=61476 RepID=A0A7R9CL80_TIMCR|nr:unnamed protein product [Timema cristinae]
MAGEVKKEDKEREREERRRKMKGRKKKRSRKERYRIDLSCTEASPLSCLLQQTGAIAGLFQIPSRRRARKRNACSTFRAASSIILNPTVGESCAIHTDCVYVAECAANRTCICRDTYVKNPSNNTTCLAGVNNSCDYDEDCIDNAFCLKQSHCECMDGRRPTKDRVTCVYIDKSLIVIQPNTPQPLVFNSPDLTTTADYASVAQLVSISASKMKRSVAGDIQAFFVRKNVMDKLADQEISNSTNTTMTESDLVEVLVGDLVSALDVDKIESGPDGGSLGGSRAFGIPPCSVGVFLFSCTDKIRSLFDMSQPGSKPSILLCCCNGFASHLAHFLTALVKYTSSEYKELLSAPWLRQTAPEVKLFSCLALVSLASLRHTPIRAKQLQLLTPEASSVVSTTYKVDLTPTQTSHATAVIGQKTVAVQPPYNIGPPFPQLQALWAWVLLPLMNNNHIERYKMKLINMDRQKKHVDYRRRRKKSKYNLTPRGKEINWNKRKKLCIVDSSGTKKVHPTEIRSSISPYSAAELNMTSALANYATEAESKHKKQMECEESSDDSDDSPFSRQDGPFSPLFQALKMEWTMMT